MQLLQDIRPYFIQKLSGIYEESEANNMAYWCIESVLAYTKSDCILKPLDSISKEQSAKLTEIVNRLRLQEPIQYILGECFFYGLSFQTNKHTLIPRPETEELVEWILKEDFDTLLDIGTGSGCIPIAIAKNASSSVSALDISESALQVAKTNAALNEVEVEFFQADILKNPSLGKFDVIVSNPPYVLESEKKLMRKNVLQHEPHTALFVKDNEALMFYNSISDWAKLHLNNNGKLFFEINEKKGNEVLLMLHEKGFGELILKKDMRGKNRMVKAIWKA